MAAKIKRSKFLLIFGAIWLIFSVPFLLVGISMIKDEKRFESESLTVQGEVTGKRVQESTSRDKDGRTSKSYSYHVTYKYKTIDNQDLEGDDTTDKEAWQKIETSAPLKVQYIVTEPTKSRMARSSSSVGGFIFSGLAVLLMLISVVCFVLDFKKGRVFKRVLESGRTTEATVTDTRPGNLTINDVTQWNVYYTFKDAQGVEHEGKTPHMPPDEAAAWTAGDKGQLKYLAEDPSQNVWIGR